MSYLIFSLKKMTGRTPAERFLAQRLASRGNCYVYVLELVDQRFAVGYVCHSDFMTTGGAKAPRGRRSIPRFAC